MNVGNNGFIYEQWVINN